MSEDKIFKLCYVKGDWAYFTTKELNEQWGDDWNDAPYEHNAGDPYGPYRPSWHGGKCDCPTCERDWNEDGTPKWEIAKVAFEGPFEQPCDHSSNSSYSVMTVNAGTVPWLTTDTRQEVSTSIFAGVSLTEFTEWVLKSGGQIYLPI